jgi:transposase-like protein
MPPREKRRRRRHTAVFKAAAIAACLEPHASVAAVALGRQLNANLLRKWVKAARDGNVPPIRTLIGGPQPPGATAGFMPLRLEPPREALPTREERPIRVHVRKGRSRITIEWPATATGACAVWLRELLG